MKPKFVVLTGAGISAESGLKTFRDSGGLWEGHRWEEVASPEGWAKHPQLVLSFYNQRIAQARAAQPNAGHLALVDLEKKFEVTILTQNVDDLHERAGSSRIVHLHGELNKVRSTVDSNLVYPLTKETIDWGDTCEKGSQLRPHIVWFGENVPAIYEAAEICREADFFLVVGTSLQVYPAAGLVDYVPKGSPIYLVDPALPNHLAKGRIHHIAGTAAQGLPPLVASLIQKN